MMCSSGFHNNYMSVEGVVDLITLAVNGGNAKGRWEMVQWKIS